MLISNATVNAIRRSLKRSYDTTFTIKLTTVAVDDFGTHSDFQGRSNPILCRLSPIRSDIARSMEIDRDRIYYYIFFTVPDDTFAAIKAGDSITVSDYGDFEIDQMFGPCDGRLEHSMIISQMQDGK